MYAREKNLFKHATDNGKQSEARLVTKQLRSSLMDVKIARSHHPASDHFFREQHFYSCTRGTESKGDEVIINNTNIMASIQMHQQIFLRMSYVEKLPKWTGGSWRSWLQQRISDHQKSYYSSINTKWRCCRRPSGAQCCPLSPLKNSPKMRMRFRETAEVMITRLCFIFYFLY